VNNRTPIVKVIVENVVTCFLGTQCISVAVELTLMLQCVTAFVHSQWRRENSAFPIRQVNRRFVRHLLTLWCPMLPYGYSYKHPVPDGFIWRSALSVRVPRCQKITNGGLTRSGIGCVIAVPIWQQWASKG